MLEFDAEMWVRSQESRVRDSVQESLLHDNVKYVLESEKREIRIPPLNEVSDSGRLGEVKT